MIDASSGEIISKETILARLHQLPVLSAVVHEVIASAKDGQTDRTHLANRISQDQGLSAKVLRVANSPFYGLSRMVGSVHEATLVLGFNSIRSMALSAALMLAFPHSASGLFDRRTYWLRSFRVACYTQALAKCLGQNQEAAFTVGMFYDIGQLVLDVCIPEQFERMLAQQKDSGLSLIEIEQSELGFDHALIGAEMARHWNFPAEIEHAIYYWRTPEREPFEWNVGMVHVAVLLETGLRGEELIGQIPATLCHRMRLTWEGIQAGIPERNHLDEEAKLILEA